MRGSCNSPEEVCCRPGAEVVRGEIGLVEIGYGLDWIERLAGERNMER